MPGLSPQSVEEAGWTITGTVVITSYVRHKSTDPPDPRGPQGTPLESIEGTVVFDLVQSDGTTAHLADGTFSLHTTVSESHPAQD
jgi:hypothetical protein